MTHAIAQGARRKVLLQRGVFAAAALCAIVGLGALWQIASVTAGSGLVEVPATPRAALQIAATQEAIVTDGSTLSLKLAGSLGSAPAGR